MEYKINDALPLAVGCLGGEYGTVIGYGAISRPLVNDHSPNDETLIEIFTAPLVEGKTPDYRNIQVDKIFFSSSILYPPHSTWRNGKLTNEKRGAKQVKVRLDLSLAHKKIVRLKNISEDITWFRRENINFKSFADSFVFCTPGKWKGRQKIIFVPCTQIVQFY